VHKLESAAHSVVTEVKEAGSAVGDAISATASAIGDAASTVGNYAAMGLAAGQHLIKEIV
jgi:hypothetical protein